MKKILLVAAVAVLSVVGANAQSFGVKAGYNYATLNGDTAKEFDLKGNSGFYVGALAELPLSDIFAIQPEVIYSRKGAKYETEFLGKKAEGTLNMDYISIPVFAKIYITEMISLQGGPQFGFLVNSPEFKTAIGGLTGSSKLDKDAFGKFDFGMGVGASVNLPAGLFVEARYAHGFTNVFNSDNKDLQSSTIDKDSDFKNSVLSVGVGYKF